MMLAETPALRLTELTLDMAPSIHENSLDDETRKYLPDEVFETLEDAQETIKFLISQYGACNGPLVYAVIRKADNCNVGYVQMVPRKDHTWEVGYHIGSRYRGNGYATEAVSAFLPIMARTIGIEAIYGICLKENIASCRVLEKCGFEKTFEGLGEYQGERRDIVKTVWHIAQ